MNDFTEEEIKIAKEVKKTILQERVTELYAIYMAGEICMWDELKDNQYTLDDMKKAFCSGAKIGFATEEDAVKHFWKPFINSIKK